MYSKNKAWSLGVGWESGLGVKTPRGGVPPFTYASGTLTQQLSSCYHGLGMVQSTCISIPMVILKYMSLKWKGRYENSFSLIILQINYLI